jgi:hypothetical protein
MRIFLFGFAYFLILTTPIQLGLLSVGIWALITTDYTFTTLTVHVFLNEYLNFLMLFYHWLLTWFWNDFLYFIFGLPMLALVSFKFVGSSLLAYWLLNHYLKDANNMPPPDRE